MMMQWKVNLLYLEYSKKVLILVISTFFFINCDFSPRIHKNIIRAQEYVIGQRYQDAIKEYNAILKDNPPDEIKVKIHYQLGEIYSTNLGENKEAIGHFEKVNEFSKDPLWLIKSQERMGEIHYSFLRDYKKSLTNYKLLFEFTPRLARRDFYEFRLAQSHVNLGNTETAKKKFTEIIKKPNHEYYIRSIYEMGSVHFLEKEWESAIEYWNDYIRKEKRRDNIVQAKFLMANAYETMEDLQTAYNIYYSILGEYPNTEVIRSRLRSIYERRIARKR